MATAAEIRIVDGDGKTPSIIDVTGQIVPGDAARFYDLVGEIENAVVFLDSPGGLVEDGLSIASEIALRGFTTIVATDRECYSVCALMWVSGGRRMMDGSASIGVHAAWRDQALENGTSLSVESGVANADIGSFLTHLGLSREAILYFTTAGPDELLPITPEIAQRLDIDTAVINGEAIEWPQDRPSPRRMIRQVVNYFGLSIQCAPIFGMDADWLKRQGENRLKQGHALFGGEVFANLLVELTALQNDAVGAVVYRRGARTPD